MQQLVRVTAIVAAVRVDAALEATLRSLASQHLPPGVVLDAVVAVAEPAASPPTSVDDLDVLVAANPGGSIPAGLNRALRIASGERIVRVDARCSLPADYVATIVRWLEDPQIGCVGGAALVMDRGFSGELYGTAFNSPLLGPSDYRYSRRTRDTDSPYLGAWRRDVLDEVGGFDERLLRNQDNELAARVKASGRRVVYDARLVVGYTAGRSIGAAIRHHYGFGLWRSRQRALGQRSVTRRQAVVVAAAPIVLFGGVVLLALAPTRPFALAAVAVAYGGAAVTASVTAARLRRARPDLQLRSVRPESAVLSPALAAAINAAWALGLFKGRRRRS